MQGTEGPSAFILHIYLNEPGSLVYIYIHFVSFGVIEKKVDLFFHIVKLRLCCSLQVLDGKMRFDLKNLAMRSKMTLKFL